MSRQPSVAHKMIDGFTPKSAELEDNGFFGDIRERQVLSKRDQSLVTLAALIAMNSPEQMLFHLDKALDNGLKKEELIEVIAHLAFYSGWPDVMTVINDGEGSIFKKGYLHLVEDI